MREAAVHEAASKLKFERDVAIFTETFLRSRNWSLHEVRCPILDVTFNGKRAFRIRLSCDQWNELPPSAEILQADGWDFKNPPPTAIINASAHPTTGKVFICMRGFREFHTHPGHRTEHWANYRDEDGNNLPGLLDQVCHAWRTGVGYP